MDLIIRRERPEDYFETEAMTRRSFWNKHRPGCNEHLLVHALRTSPLYLPELSRVAELDGRIVGTIMYYRARLVTPGGEITVPSFGPLCADHSMKNRGVGRALLEETLPLARGAGYPGVIIFGEPEYYPRRGFVRAGSLGLTDMEGNAYDPFMAYEFEPGSLRIAGARFDEAAVTKDLTDEALAALEDARGYEYLAKAVRPCQWTYENASEEKDGYSLQYAVKAPRAFDEMFTTYIGELAQYDGALKHHDVAAMEKELREDVNKTRYIVTVNGESAGLLVTSVPETREEALRDGCGNYLEELWIRPEHRRRGIATDIVKRYLRQQKTDTGFCVIPDNPAGAFWTGLLKKEGYEYTVAPGEEDLLFFHVRNGK